MVKSTFSPREQEQGKLPQAIAPNIQKIALDVSGMKCAGCVKAVEKQLTQSSGVVSAYVNLITEVAVVEYEAKSIVPETLAERLTKSGFPSELRPSDRSIYQAAAENRDKQAKQEQQRRQQLIAAIILLVFSSIGHLHHLGLPTIPFLSNIWVHFALATVALIIPGRTLLIDGARSLRQGMPNMNTLIGLGTLSAYLASCFALFFPRLGWECFFDEPVMLLGFILLGRTLEGKARTRASAALEKLVTLQPSTARLVNQPDQTTAIEIPAEQVRVGEWLRVLPGEKIPVDGKIIEGTTSIDESMLTGESASITKTKTDSVRAGTINQSGIITICVTGIGQDTALAKIINLVETAQTRKAPIQKLADTIAGYFAYGVMGIATITFLFWYLIGTNLWSYVLEIASHPMAMNTMPSATTPLLLSLKLAIAVLVIACPCALGLATPTAILVGTSVGAESGILIKGGDILEQVSQLDTIIFDKTGTLTQGRPQVTTYVPTTDITPQHLLQIAASIEQGSNHPLAQAILDEAESQKLSLLEARDFQLAIGQGMSAIIEGEQAYLGNRDWILHQNITIPSDYEEQFSNLFHSEQTIVYLAINGRVQGIIGIADPLRPDAFHTIQQLQELGLDIALVTGDRSEVAQEIATQLQITQIFAEVQPEEKAQIVRSLQQTKTVAMIGDGINDAPALAQADVGISLQGGTDVAIATADIVLMQNQLQNLIKSIELSQATVTKIRQNLFWALAYNFLAIPIAAGILLPHYGIILTPVWAAIAMALSSLIVVTNSLLLNANNPN